MKVRHIRWIAIIGLLAIIGLQYVWLTNTYAMAKESLQVKCDNLFRDAALNEVFHRLEAWKRENSPSDSVTSVSVNLGIGDDTVHAEIMSAPSSQIMTALHIAFQEKLARMYRKEVSLSDLDSIYLHLLDSVGIRAKVATCLTDSAGRIIRISSSSIPPVSGRLETGLVPVDFAGTRFLQGIITNPYSLIFRQMLLLVLATALIMILVIVCLVWQIRIILRQDKIARVREDFSYAMIHDMKTPLTSILMGSRLLETGKLDAQPEKRARCFRILKEEGEHLLSLINRALTLSKFENHQVRPVLASCSLQNMLEQLAEVYRTKAGKPVEYVWNLQAETVYADEEFLKEALSNLIDNSIKYSGDSVTITFSSEQLPGGKTRIRIKDNGFGIPLREQSLIFEKYERASAAGRARRGGASGFGLGLNYVLRCVEAHGGTVSVESIEGEYTEFSLVLPSADKCAEEDTGTGRNE